MHSTTQTAFHAPTGWGLYSETSPQTAGNGSQRLICIGGTVAAAKAAALIEDYTYLRH